MVSFGRQITTWLRCATCCVVLAAACRSGEALAPVKTPVPIVASEETTGKPVAVSARNDENARRAAPNAETVAEIVETKAMAGQTLLRDGTRQAEKNVGVTHVADDEELDVVYERNNLTGAKPGDPPVIRAEDVKTVPQAPDHNIPDGTVDQIIKGGGPTPEPRVGIQTSTSIDKNVSSKIETQTTPLKDSKSQFTGPATGSCRDKLDDEELEMVYQPSAIEGYAGWKKNKVPQRELIDNDMIGIADRWRIGLNRDSRHIKGNFWNPYRQNMLKGDYPIIGQSIFLDTTFASDTFIEGHSNPTPSGVTSVGPGRFDFFGGANQLLIQQNFIISLELFKGETSFKPPEWTVKITPVFNINYLETEENFAVNIDPRQGRKRLDSHESFQEFFGEYHFADLSPNYDFIAGRMGIQFFNEDFRGFLFADNNLGARAFGILESNRLQYNLAAFDMLNKDTNSGLNSFNLKGQHVLLANLIRADTFWKGHNLIFNMAYNDEESNTHYNENGVIVRPSPIGDLRPHENKIGYVGVGQDGHIGRLNVTSQFYQAFGKDTHSNISGIAQHVNAQMGAAELSYDMDWMRFRASAFYASGDSNVHDGKASGFDSIFDDPNFAGGHNSWWVSQGGFALGNTLTALKQRNSLLPSLNTSKGEGQRNFVNPGLRLLNVGYDADLTQNLKAVANVNYLQFDKTAALEELLHQPNISRSIGFDYSLGMLYRPWLNNQVVINGGASALQPGQGFKDIYAAKKQFYYAGFLNLTVRY